MSTKKLTGKVALVTGASKGIGAAIAKQFAAEGVRAAGIAESDMRKQVEAQTPLGRIGQPQDIATAALFFASSDSAWITGETVTVAGGY